MTNPNPYAGHRDPTPAERAERLVEGFTWGPSDPLPADPARLRRAWRACPDLRAEFGGSFEALRALHRKGGRRQPGRDVRRGRLSVARLLDELAQLEAEARAPGRDAVRELARRIAAGEDVPPAEAYRLLEEARASVADLEGEVASARRRLELAEVLRHADEAEAARGRAFGRYARACERERELARATGELKAEKQRAAAARDGALAELARVEAAEVELGKLVSPALRERVAAARVARDEARAEASQRPGDEQARARLERADVELSAAREDLAVW